MLLHRPASREESDFSAYVEHVPVSQPLAAVLDRLRDLVSEELKAAEPRQEATQSAALESLAPSTAKPGPSDAMTRAQVERLLDSRMEQAFVRSATRALR